MTGFKPRSPCFSSANVATTTAVRFNKFLFKIKMFQILQRSLHADHRLRSSGESRWGARDTNYAWASPRIASRPPSCWPRQGWTRAAVDSGSTRTCPSPSRSRLMSTQRREKRLERSFRWITEAFVSQNVYRIKTLPLWCLNELLLTLYLGMPIEEGDTFKKYSFLLVF